jgi:formylglycine-generating enzyme required for sulfatase activity
MVVVPAGSFTMGSPAGAKDRLDNEGPQHVVTISKPFAVSKLHVTVDQFAAFVRETGYETSSTCKSYDGGKPQVNGSWRNPGFAQEGSHPVVYVSWDDARAYVRWLQGKTFQPYRLLSEAEWEYAARGRTSPGAYPRFWFGDHEKDLCRYGNGADEKVRDSLKVRDKKAWESDDKKVWGSIERKKDWAVAPCNDGYVYTSPAGHYEPNAFGLFDMFGNAWQSTADCYHGSYDGAPADSWAWTTGCQERGGSRVIRGGSWGDLPKGLGLAKRAAFTGEFNAVGFRVARLLSGWAP